MNETMGQLPAKWRAEAEEIADLDETHWRALRQCADELEQALESAGANIVAAFKAVGEAL